MPVADFRNFSQVVENTGRGLVVLAEENVRLFSLDGLLKQLIINIFSKCNLEINCRNIVVFA